MRRLPLILALALTACAAPAPQATSLDGLLERLEAGEAEAFEPALRELSAKGSVAARERFVAALPAVPLSRAQAERLLAPAFPEAARDLIAARHRPLAVSADEAGLAEAVARTAARLDDWVVAGQGGARLRLRRIAPGDAFELVLKRGREPVRDAIRRVECPAPAPIACATEPLARTAIELLGQ